MSRPESEVSIKTATRASTWKRRLTDTACESGAHLEHVDVGLCPAIQDSVINLLFAPSVAAEEDVRGGGREGPVQGGRLRVLKLANCGVADNFGARRS